MSHHCHAVGCPTYCKPELLMCFRHWRMVPKHLQKLVWEFYRPGQCNDMRISREWHLSATRAINAVALKEGILTKKQAIRRLVRILKLYRGVENASG